MRTTRFRTSAMPVPGVTHRPHRPVPSTSAPGVRAQTPEAPHVAEVLRLQRTIGNQAVQRLLAGARSAAGGGTGDRVQRFPQSVLQQPYKKWGEATETVEASTTGKAGGVYFFKSKQDEQYGDVSEVVVKPLGYVGGEGSSSPERSEFAHAILHEFGFATPDSRPVVPGTAEFDQLKQLSEGTNKPLPEKTNSLVVMSKVRGTGLLSLAQGPKGGMTAADVDRLVGVLKDEARAYKMGELIVVDALMGNRDRVGGESHRGWKLNLDNIMVTMDSFATIDSSARLSESIESKYAGPDVDPLTMLHSQESVKELANEIFTTLRAELGKAAPAQPPFSPLEHFQAAFGESDQDHFKETIARGVRGGKLRVRALARRRDRTNQPEGDRRRRLKEQSQKQYLPEKEELSSYNVLKANAKYLDLYEELMQTGTYEADEAHALALKHAQDYFKRRQQKRLKDELNGYQLSDRVKRVLPLTELEDDDTLRLTILFKRGGLSVKAQNKLIHVRPHGVKQKQKKQKGDPHLNERLDAFRAGLVNQIFKEIQYGPTGFLPRAMARVQQVLDLQVYEVQPSPERAQQLCNLLLKLLPGAAAEKYFPKNT